MFRVRCKSRELFYTLLYNDSNSAAPITESGLSVSSCPTPDSTLALMTNLRHGLNIVDPVSLQSGPFWEEHETLWICEHFSHMVPFFSANCGSLAAPLINYITAQQTSILGSVRGHVRRSWKHFFMTQAPCPVPALHQRQAWHQSGNGVLVWDVRRALCARQIHTAHRISVKRCHRNVLRSENGSSIDVQILFMSVYKARLITVRWVSFINGSLAERLV